MNYISPLHVLPVYDEFIYGTVSVRLVQLVVQLDTYTQTLSPLVVPNMWLVHEHTLLVLRGGGH